MEKELKLQIGNGVNVNYSMEDKLNKYEVGPTGNRFTLYYKDIEDLKKQLNELKEAELLK